MREKYRESDTDTTDDEYKRENGSWKKWRRNKKRLKRGRNASGSKLCLTTQSAPSRVRLMCGDGDIHSQQCHQMSGE